MDPFVSLTDGKVHVWRFQKPQTEVGIWCESVKLVLTPDELQKAHRFIKIADQERSMLARGILRLLLARYLNVSALNVSLNYNHYGKPQLASLEPSLVFNVSHSADWIVFAFAKKKLLGIDVEECKPRLDFLALAEQFATPIEIQQLQAATGDEIAATFYRLWSAKEAVIKAKGLGFYADTKKFSVCCQLNSPLKMIDCDEEWLLQEFKPAANVIGCVAVDDPLAEFLHFQVGEDILGVV